MAGLGNLIVGGQLQVTPNLPAGVPSLPATCLGGGAGTPPINGSFWTEGPVLIGSPVSFPLPRPTATLMIGRSKNYLAPETTGLPIIRVTSLGAAPTPTDLLIGDPAGIVGMTINSQVISIFNAKTVSIISPDTTGVGKLNWVGKVNIAGNTNITPKLNVTGKVTVGGAVNIGGKLVVGGVINSPTIEALKLKISLKKGFDIQHPTKKDHRLRYICVEGPAAEVYLRGKLDGNNVIELPEYWKDLVHIDTIGVSLTPTSVYQELFIEKIEWGSRVVVKNNLGGPIKCDFVVFAERKDTTRNIPEYKGLTPMDYPGDNSEYTINGG